MFLAQSKNRACYNLRRFTGAVWLEFSHSEDLAERKFTNRPRVSALSCSGTAKFK